MKQSGPQETNSLLFRCCWYILIDKPFYLHEKNILAFKCYFSRAYQSLDVYWGLTTIAWLSSEGSMHSDILWESMLKFNLKHNISHLGMFKFIKTSKIGWFGVWVWAGLLFRFLRWDHWYCRWATLGARISGDVQAKTKLRPVDSTHLARNKGIRRCVKKLSCRE